MSFTETDIQYIENKGLTLETVKRQIRLFKQGLPFINIKEAATIGNGIYSFSEEEINKYIGVFNTKRDTLKLLKFVPASGAATRMFKFLFDFLKEFEPNKESINSYINKHKASELSMFLIGLEKFPFYNEVISKLKKDHPNFETLDNDEQKYLFIKTMLEEDQLNYGFYPKGLFPFHKYKEHISTAFEEHLFEAVRYATSNNKAYLHFTISEAHKNIFDEEFKRIETIIEKKTNTQFDITFSFQKQSTDTIALNTKNEPFRDDNNNLVFRPSGHGALLENLNDLDADLIFIKNIDNVVVYKYEEEVAKYKKMLAGLLLETQEQAFKFLSQLDQNNISEQELITIAEFLTNKMNSEISTEFEKYSLNHQITYLRNKLNRPIRVCGMVKNEGEPGGGPFWVKDESGKVSLQIVESAQIDKKNRVQKDILKNATHFNPVDVVCGIKDYKGNAFDLKKFVDNKTGFITMKTKVGKDLKALELPGLWNGSMAHWNTLFVEVPLVTFSPVKTVNDLLKAAHQIK
ncbi:DUF4301 family protein [Lacinutrix salivirga]